MGIEVREFLMPVRIIMGPGSIQNVGAEVTKLSLNRILIVTDPGVNKTGVLECVKKPLDASGCAYAVFSEVEPNPSGAVATSAHNFFKREQCQGIIGIGGGSSIDTAKAVSILATNEGRIEDYAGMDAYKNPPAPLLVIPTTVGTGSEVTRGAVITDTSVKRKLVIRGMKLYPKVAILDPELLTLLPPRVTAATGMDALTHAIEGYVSMFWNPISDGLHRHAISLIGKNLRGAVANSENLDAMYNMLVGSTIAGIAFANTFCGLVHAMSHPVSAHFGVSHGDANAILLKYVMEFNWIAKPERYADIAYLLGGKKYESVIEMARSSVEVVSQLAHDVGIPSGLAQVGVNKNAIEVMAKDAVLDPQCNANPRRPTYEDIVGLYKKAM